MSRNQFAAVVVCAIVVLGSLAYANTFTGSWVWDDVSSVLLHENVQQPGQLLQLFREDQHAFGRGQGNFYRPLVAASFMLDFWLSYDPVLDSGERIGYPDVKPLIFHLTNLVWHVSAAVLLFFLLVRLQAPRILQAVVPVLYVLHPMHTEAVAYISGRADMMSATFMFGALLCATVESGRLKYLAVAASGLLFALGLCSKESTMIYPVLLGLVIFMRPGSNGVAPSTALWKERSIPLALSGIILVVYGALRATVLKFAEGGGGSDTGLAHRFVETAQAFAFYIQTLFVPIGLHMEQTLEGAGVVSALAGLLLIVVVIVSMVLAYRAGNRRVTLGFAWFLASWLPISGIFPLNAPMAEHWMYVPMAGFWWATLELLLLLGKRTGIRILLPGLATALSLLFLYGTVHRNQDWRSNEAIFQATLAENPDTLRVHSNLATTYDYLEGNLPGARRHYEEVLDRYARNREGKNQILPDEIPFRLSLAEVMLRQGDYPDSIRQYGVLMGLEGNPAFKAEVAQAYLGTGQCFLALGNYNQGMQLIQKAAELDPALARAGNDMLHGKPFPANR